MRKKALTKAIAVATCLAVLSLSAPGLFAAERPIQKYHFKNIIKIPIMFIASFISFIPIYDTGKYVISPDVNKKVNGIKITGVLDSARPIEDD